MEKKSREEREREEKGDRKILDRMEKRWMKINDEEYFKLLDSGFDPSRVHLGSHSAREIGMAKVATKFPNLILDS